MEAVSDSRSQQRLAVTIIEWTEYTTSDRAGRSPALVFEALFVLPPHGKLGSSVVMVGCRRAGSLAPLQTPAEGYRS